jgi:hypothetical protein
MRATLDYITASGGVEHCGGRLRPVLRTVIDPRDFNRMFFDLVDRDVGREYQLSPPADASGAAAVGRMAQRPAAVVDGFHSRKSSGGIVLGYALKYAFQIIGCQR